MNRLRLVVLGFYIMTMPLYAEDIKNAEVISDEDIEVIKNMAMLKEMKMITDENYNIVQQNDMAEKETYDQ